jgi:hypothetical protein
MKTRVLALLLGLSLLGRPTPSALGTLMPVDEVKAGMTGEGFTVFEGTRRDSFKVHVLGVLQNVTGPRRNLILARLEGGPLATTGVIAGMSGSPVYIDGRLLGAVAFSLGSFSREPIAGITPIAEMIEATEVSTPRPPTHRGAIPLPMSHEVMVAALKDALPRARPFAERAGDVRTVSGSGIDPFALSLRPVATPLSIAGFSGDAR